MRVATTIIQVTPGSQEWFTALEPSCDPGDHRQFLKSLPPGDQIGLVLESGGSVGKKRKVTYAPPGASPAPTRKRKKSSL